MCLYFQLRFGFSPTTLKIMEKIDFKWRERDNRCAGSSVLVGTNYFMTNEGLSKTVDILVGTVQRIRSNLIESRDISKAFDGLPRDLEDARKVRSKEVPGPH